MFYHAINFKSSFSCKRPALATTMFFEFPRWLLMRVSTVIGTVAITLQLWIMVLSWHCWFHLEVRYNLCRNSKCWLSFWTQTMFWQQLLQNKAVSVKSISAFMGLQSMSVNTWFQKKWQTMKKGYASLMQEKWFTKDYLKTIE